jgi:hypothetical protein
MLHYDLEDIPPQDGDTQIDLYESARAITKDAPTKAQASLDQIGAALEELYIAAQSRDDSAAMTAITDAWQRAQSIAEHVVQSGAALAGADAAVEVLRQQRESLAYELETLLQAIDDLDTSHPTLESAFESFRDEAIEQADEWASEVLYDSIYAAMKPIIVSFATEKSVYRLTDRLIQMFTGDRALTPLQQDLILQLLQTIEA